MTPVRGEGLDPAARVEVVNTRLETLPAGASWALRGVTSNLRYTTRDEKERLAAVEPATWFDYAPEHERDFDALLAELRASEEWSYAEREIDIRLVQVG